MLRVKSSHIIYTPISSSETTDCLPKRSELNFQNWQNDETFFLLIFYRVCLHLLLLLLQLLFPFQLIHSLTSLFILEAINNGLSNHFTKCVKTDKAQALVRWLRPDFEMAWKLDSPLSNLETWDSIDDCVSSFSLSPGRGRGPAGTRSQWQTINAAYCCNLSLSSLSLPLSIILYSKNRGLFWLDTRQKSILIELFFQ